MTNKELGNAIRKELKTSGYKTRDFSVRVRDSLYDTAVNIKIKNPEINRKEIEKILNKFKAIDYDERSGEILAGGNTYIFIDYESGIFEIPAQEWAATARGILESKDETTKIFDGLYLINWKHSGNLEIQQQDGREHCTLKVCDFSSLCVFLYKFAKFGTIAA